MFTDTKSYFKDSYQRSSDIWSYIPHLEKTLYFTPNKKSICLDIGSGRSEFPILLAEKGHEVIAIDFISDVINTQNKEVQKRGLQKNLRYITADATKIPFPDESFDFISDIECFQYLSPKEYGSYIHEVRRLLRDESYYLQVSLSKKTARIYGHEPRKSDLGYFKQFGVKHHFFTKKKIKDLFENYFEILHQEEQSFNLPSDPKDSVTLIFSVMKKKKTKH